MPTRVVPLGCSAVRTRAATLGAIVALVVGLAACGGASHTKGARRATASSTSEGPLPGAGKPPITIGDKNFTEQFLLGQLYMQALQAQGYDVIVNRNIGPTEVTIQALASGRIDMYPEYLSAWTTRVAGYRRQFSSARAAYQAGQRYALAHGFELLNPTPFSDADSIAVKARYASQNGLVAIGDLSKVASSLVLGGPAQFQQDPGGLPALERAYSLSPASFKQLQIGEQYTSLDADIVQAADVQSTDGQLESGDYRLLKDPQHVFGWGNAIPVVSVKATQTEGPAFASTINKVSSLLTMHVIRRLNAAVDVSHEDPTAVAKQFLQAHGLLPASGS